MNLVNISNLPNIFSMKKDIVLVREATKHKENPFLQNDIFQVKKGKSTVIAGSTKKVMVDIETGETEGIALVHRYKEVDTAEFVKIFKDEIKSTFDLSKTGNKAFGYILSILPIRSATIYLNISKMVEYCEWKTTVSAYQGLGELIKNKIIAPSMEPNLWFINPSIIFNGDRYAFIKEYRLKRKAPDNKQLEIPDPLDEMNKK